MIKVLIFLSTRRTAFRMVLSQRTTPLLRRIVRALCSYDVADGPRTKCRILIGIFPGAEM